MTVYLIRHGESVANLDGRFAGWRPVSLTARGRQQAARLPAYFADIPLAAVWASDLARAVETARPLAQSQRLPVRRSRALREIHGGDWEGLSFDVIAARWPAAYRCWREDIGAAACPGGESVAQMARRVEAALARLAAQPRFRDAAVAAVTHGGAIRALTALWESGSLGAMCRTAWAANASVLVAQHDGHGWQVVRANDCTHLSGLLTELPATI